jgi:hypothetical protein
MYKIIGADQKEYGPITSDQIRQWIAQGRLNANTLALADGTPEWKPLSAFPEFAEALGINPLTSTFSAQGVSASTVDVLAKDYNLDIGSCISRSWALVKKNFWPVVGITFLIMMIPQLLNQAFSIFTRPIIKEMVVSHSFSATGIFIILLTWIIAMPISSVFIGGLMKYYLKLIRGENATMSDAFSGFSSALGPLALLGLVQGFLVLVGFVFCLIPGIYLATAWYFATPLVIDRGMNFWDAMEFSRKVVSKHWFAVFGLMLVAGLVAMAGLLACGIGILVTMPIGLVALMYGYDDIFGRPH